MVLLEEIYLLFHIFLSSKVNGQLWTILEENWSSQPAYGPQRTISKFCKGNDDFDKFRQMRIVYYTWGGLSILFRMGTQRKECWRPRPGSTCTPKMDLKTWKTELSDAECIDDFAGLLPMTEELILVLTFPPPLPGPREPTRRET